MSSAELPEPSFGPVLAVTGSSGFVGRNLVHWLAGQRHKVVAISRAASEPWPQGVQTRTVPDYADVSALAAGFEGAHAVIHLAGRAHVLGEESREAAIAEFERANVGTSLACAEAAVLAGCGRFVLVSSIGVMGRSTQGQPFTECREPSPQEPYARSKWQAERAVVERLTGTDLEWVILRPPLVYGPGCPGNFRALLSLVRGIPVLPFGALRARRSYIGIENLCSALTTAALHPSCAGRRFVLSDGDDIDLATLVRLLADGMGRGFVPQWSVPVAVLKVIAALAGRRAAFEKLAGELLVDSGEFRRCTDWQPPFTLSRGLTLTAAAYSQGATLVKRPG
jgi:nucleoside-diphosphate-sugar epimerase